MDLPKKPCYTIADYELGRTVKAMANENGVRLRFRPLGSAERRRGAPEYGPLGTGCPAVEQAVTALYKAQNEESFWTLMNALNYALELDTHVLVPLVTVPDQKDGTAPWAEHPIPAEKAKDLPLWTLRTQKGRNYLPIFTSVKMAEADRGTAARPMAEMLLADAMQKVLDTADIDGIVLDPWTSSATLDGSLLNGLLHAGHESEEPGEEELALGNKAALAEQWSDALHYYEQAAEQGRAEALSMLGELLYEGKGVRRSVTQARRMWKKAADSGDVLAMIALGDDCIASGKGTGAALQYYRRAQTASRATPDIAYMPQVRLRVAQYETRFTSRRLALAQMAEAKQGFKIRLREGDPAAEEWLKETEAAIRQLMEEESR